MGAHLGSAIRSKADRSTLSHMDVPRGSVDTIMKEQSDVRREVISAIRNGEINAGINEIRGKIQAIKGEEKEK